MDWDHAINRQHSALDRIIAMLFAMVGLQEGASISHLPLPLYRAVLRILYPAESAVRRLIVVMARGLVLAPAVSRPFPPGLKSLQRPAARRMSFRLADPRRSFNAGHHPTGATTRPRIHAFSGGELVTIFGRSPLDPAPAANDSVAATRLCLRLAAIKSALDNLPRQARRLARWRARQAALPPEKMRRPLRFGRPPGHRKESLEEVDEVLKDCHWLAWEAGKLDTS